MAAQIDTAKPLDGGKVVNGIRAYASGCMHVHRALNDIRILDGAGQQVDANFACLPLPSCMHASPADVVVTVQDWWHVAGPAASGSHTLLAKDAWLPMPLGLRSSQLRAAASSTRATVLAPSGKWPFEPLFPQGVLSPMLGPPMPCSSR